MGSATGGRAHVLSVHMDVYLHRIATCVIRHVKTVTIRAGNSLIIMVTARGYGNAEVRPERSRSGYAVGFGVGLFNSPTPYCYPQQSDKPVGLFAAQRSIP
jgi:hypothetical protein